MPAERIVDALNSRFPPGDVEDVIQRFTRDVGRVVIHALPADVVRVTWTGHASFAALARSSPFALGVQERGQERNGVLACLQDSGVCASSSAGPL